MLEPPGAPKWNENQSNGAKRRKVNYIIVNYPSGHCLAKILCGHNHAEIEAAENAVVILNAYIFRVYKYYPDNRQRKMTGLFTSEFKGSKNPIPEHKELTKTFKAFIFSIRSNVYNYAPPGWSIIEEPDVGWLGELVAEPSSIFDSYST